MSAVLPEYVLVRVGVGRTTLGFRLGKSSERDLSIFGACTEYGVVDVCLVATAGKDDTSLREINSMSQG